MDLASQAGPWGLLLLVVGSVVTALIRGRLVPLSTHLREMDYLERTISTLEATVREREEQIAILLGRVREPVP